MLAKTQLQDCFYLRVVFVSKGWQYSNSTTQIWYTPTSSWKKTRLMAWLHENVFGHEPCPHINGFVNVALAFALGYRYVTGKMRIGPIPAPGRISWLTSPRPDHTYVVWWPFRQPTNQCFVFCSRGRTGLKLGHVGKVNIQTYVLELCVLEGREWDHMITMHCCTKRMKKFSIANHWLGKIQRSTYGIGVGLWAGEEVRQCKT